MTPLQVDRPPALTGGFFRSRSTYPPGNERNGVTGANDSTVAAALGDRDSRMGAHYTRHVENEIKVVAAFGGGPKRKLPKRKK
jgi:hypothetical protein